MGLARRFIWLAVSSVILGACGSTDGDGSSGGGAGATAGGNGGSAGMSTGSSGKPSGGSSSTPGGSAGAAPIAGTMSDPPANACAGFPLDCIQLCQGGLCDCYCEQGPACAESPPDAGSCENCYFDSDCPDGQRCYGAECGQSATAPALGDCRTPPEPGGCWGDEDCSGPLICDGASVCECGAACLVEDVPGSCVRP